MNLLDAALRQPNIKTTQAQEQMSAISAAPIATTSLKKPDRPKQSYIVHDKFYMAPVNFVKDINENLVNIGKGVKGHSSDHDLGRINDFAMKAGALGLAGYLFVKAKTPMTKLMEFVGFGSFFASMALWPKLFIEKPLKAMYGLNIHQKYVDNEGRKKSFFQDPQYIPWDLYSEDELSKLGDRLGVPRDLHNRNEVIKRRAQKIALQGNTLWMLTAGFATPIMSALICSGAEKVIAPQLEKLRLRKATKDLEKIDKLTEKAMQGYAPKKLNEILTVNMNRQITTEIFELMSKQMIHDSDVLGCEFVEAQLSEIMNQSNKVATKEYAERFFAYLKKNDVNYENYKFESGIKEQILALADGKISQVVFHEKVKQVLFRNNISENDISIFVKNTRKFRQLKSNVSVLVITPEIAEQIKMLDRKLYEFGARKAVIDRFNNAHLGNVGETYAANAWNRVTHTFLKVLGIKDKELAKAKTLGPESYDLLLKKLDALASDETAYKKAVSKIQVEILKFDRMILPDKADGASQGVRAVLDKYYTELANTYAVKFKELGYEKISERLIGDKVTSLGSLRENLNDTTFRRTWELRNGFYKILHVLDCFKRASDAQKGWDNSTFAQTYRNLSNSYGGVELHPTAETFAKDLADFKRIVLRSSVADNTVKFGYNNAQFGLYDRMLKLIYTTDFDKSTLEALKDEKLGATTFMEAFRKKIGDTLSNIGLFDYPHAAKVKAQNIGGWVGDILVRDSLIGPRMDKVFRETASNVYNTRKWLKMFGGAGLVLAAITLFAETKFGKLPQNDVLAGKELK